MSEQDGIPTLAIDGCIQSKRNISEDYVDSIKDITDDFYYSIEGQKVAVIFNHYSYDKTKFPPNKVPSNRNGTHEDTNTLTSTLKELNFDKVDVHEDRTFQEIEDLCTEVAKADHSSTSCLVVVIMTHGDDGGILLANDGRYRLDTILDLFTATKAKTLATKPKLFFIQACRGDNFDAGYLVIDGHPSFVPANKPTSYKISAHADMLVMYSAYPGYASWREQDGSWFIRTLCQQITSKHRDWDLNSILTFVTHIVSRNWESRNSIQRQFHGKKQTPQVTTTLTKLFKFGGHPK